MSGANLALAMLLTSASIPPAATIETLFSAFNKHDVVALQRLYAPTAILNSTDFCHARTGADVTRTYRALFEAYPDINDKVDTVIVEGDRAAVRFTSESKIAGRAFKTRLVTFFRFHDDAIVEDDTFFDTGGRPCEP